MQENIKAQKGLWLTQGHTASEWKSWNQTQVSIAATVPTPSPSLQMLQVLPWLCHLYLVPWELPPPQYQPPGSGPLLSGIPSCPATPTEHWLTSIWEECTGPRLSPRARGLGKEAPASLSCSNLGPESETYSRCSLGIILCKMGTSFPLYTYTSLPTSLPPSLKRAPPGLRINDQSL